MHWDLRNSSIALEAVAQDVEASAYVHGDRACVSV